MLACSRRWQPWCFRGQSIKHKWGRKSDQMHSLSCSCLGFNFHPSRPWFKYYSTFFKYFWATALACLELQMGGVSHFGTILLVTFSQTSSIRHRKSIWSQVYIPKPQWDITPSLCLFSLLGKGPGVAKMALVIVRQGSWPTRGSGVLARLHTLVI